jgi:hypothetical protein
MAGRRDDFPSSVKHLLGRRVGMKCSNPDCRKATSGPHERPDKAVSIGVAAHITGAAPGGPRYDSALSTNARRSIGNGIWLCQSCAKLIDSDEARYTPARLRQWKQESEAATRRELEGAARVPNTAPNRSIRSRLDLLRDLPQVPPLDS